MLVTLINPPALPARFAYSSISHPPLGLAYIASSLQQAGYSVHIIDAVGEAISRVTRYTASKKFMRQGLSTATIIAKIPPDTGLIGFSCMFTHAWPLARSIINRTARAFPGIPIIAGGEHPTAMPETCLSQAALTACVLGEGEKTMVDIAHAVDHNLELSTVAGLAWKNGKTKKIITTTPRAPEADIDTLPRPAWNLVPWRNYRLYEGPVSSGTMPMLGTRGCPFRCAFCSAPAMWGHAWRKRNPARITDEMECYVSVYHIKEFQFFDISSMIDGQWVRQLCLDVLARKLDIKWHMPVGIRSETFDDEIARLLVKSGCDYIQFAPESGSARLLKQMNKKIDLNHFLQAVKAATNSGMRVCSLFIIGYPGETGADIRRTFRLIRRLAKSGVQEIAISSFVLLPGTEIFASLYQQGRVVVDDTFFYRTAGATMPGPTTSWNPPFSDRRLMILKWLGLAQFYGISFLYHPRRPLRLLTNLLRRRQETKADRVLREVLEKFKGR